MARVRSLLAQRVDPNETHPSGGDETQNNTPLHSAVGSWDNDVPSADREKITALLLSAPGIDVNLVSGPRDSHGRDAINRTALMWAVDTGEVGCVRALLNAKGIDVHRPFTALGQLDSQYGGALEFCAASAA